MKTISNSYKMTSIGGIDNPCENKIFKNFNMTNFIGIENICENKMSYDDNKMTNNSGIHNPFKNSVSNSDCKMTNTSVISLCEKDYVEKFTETCIDACKKLQTSSNCDIEKITERIDSISLNETDNKGSKDQQESKNTSRSDFLSEEVEHHSEEKIVVRGPVNINDDKRTAYPSSKKLVSTNVKSNIQKVLNNKNFSEVLSITTKPFMSGGIVISQRLEPESQHLSIGATYSVHSPDSSTSPGSFYSNNLTSPFSEELQSPFSDVSCASELCGDESCIDLLDSSSPVPENIWEFVMECEENQHCNNVINKSDPSISKSCKGWDEHILFQKFIQDKDNLQQPNETSSHSDDYNSFKNFIESQEHALKNYSTDFKCQQSDSFNSTCNPQNSMGSVTSQSILYSTSNAHCSSFEQNSFSDLDSFPIQNPTDIHDSLSVNQSDIFQKSNIIPDASFNLPSTFQNQSIHCDSSSNYCNYILQIPNTSLLDNKNTVVQVPVTNVSVDCSPYSENTRTQQKANVNKMQNYSDDVKVSLSNQDLSLQNFSIVDCSKSCGFQNTSSVQKGFSSLQEQQLIVRDNTLSNQNFVTEFIETIDLATTSNALQSSCTTQIPGSITTNSSSQNPDNAQIVDSTEFNNPAQNFNATKTNCELQKNSVSENFNTTVSSCIGNDSKHNFQSHNSIPAAIRDNCKRVPQILSQQNCVNGSLSTVTWIISNKVLPRTRRILPKPDKNQVVSESSDSCQMLLSTQNCKVTSQVKNRKERFGHKFKYKGSALEELRKTMNSKDIDKYSLKVNLKMANEPEKNEFIFKMDEYGSFIHRAIKTNNLVQTFVLLKNWKLVRENQRINYIKEINSQDKDGRTLLHCAVLGMPHTPLLTKAILELGADITIKDAKGESPLHYAACRGLDFVEVLQVLTDMSGNVNIKNSNGQTPLHYAVLNHGAKHKNEKEKSDQNGVVDNCTTIRLLLEKKALLTCQDSQGQTPIHYAVRNHKGIEILKLFNKHSPECPKEAINIQDVNGQSALHLAAKDSLSNSTTHLELVKILIANGAMTQVKDKNNKLPMDLVPEGNREVVSVLQSIWTRNGWIVQNSTVNTKHPNQP
ncbi:uncharacterized protein LOC106478639 [Limulus polyphemus]|uniref:Uncharacterized protein LOC106478639 n=1 Tax=Limulus polyphemus TaxID=6850 RepID=A0ABM1C5M4_LIMPO|nr:uncharacterized protein LOC106478639 [Limulus polyphemus]XP_013794651.1 uncharacterized protein LOC106478639 [Limulus polyphemus]